MIVGDAAYPMKPWLMRPYTGANLTPKEKAFNYHHSSVRIVVEKAFGQLKARWRTLKRRLDVHIEEVPFIIGAWCVLQNLSTYVKTPERLPRQTMTVMSNHPAQAGNLILWSTAVSEKQLQILYTRHVIPIRWLVS